MNARSKIQAITNIGSNQGKPVNSCSYIGITALCFSPSVQSPQLLHYFPRLYFERILYHAIPRFHSIEFENNARRSRAVRFAACHIEIFVRGNTRYVRFSLCRETKRETARWKGMVFRWPVAGTPHASNMQIAPTEAHLHDDRDAGAGMHT